MFTKKDRKIANLEAKIKNRDKLVDGQREENHCLYEEIKKLRIENEEQEELIGQILDTAITGPLDSEKIILEKIKELIRNYQSQN